MTFTGAIRSDHLNISAISPELFIIIIVFILVLIAYFKSHYLNSLLKKVGQGLIKHQFVVLSVLSMLVIAWQLLFIFKTKTAIGFDVGGVVSQALNGTSTNDYFSYNPNNLPLLFEEYFWKNHFGGSWFSFDILSLVSTDFAFLITVLTTRYLSKKNMYITWILSLILLSCFPYIIVPYTDTLVLPLVSLALLGYFMIKKSNHIFVKLLGSLLLGVFGASAYLLKPSAIIFVIAIIVTEVVYSIFKSKKFKPLYTVLILLLAFGSGIGIKKTYDSYQNKQEYIKVDHSMRKPPLMFLAMGMSGNGGFDMGLTLQTMAAPTQHEKKEIASERIKKTLKDYGPVGYVQFLLAKNTFNTADGSFGWLQEGNFITAPATNNLQQLVYPDGKHLKDFFFVTQVLWILLILILIIRYRLPKSSESIAFLLKLSIIGSLMYLLLFEGGRSRYVIQFLPQFIMLASIVVTAYLSKKPLKHQPVSDTESK